MKGQFFCYMLICCIESGNMRINTNDIGANMWNIFSEIIPPVNLIFTNKCIADLGCFYTGPPFYNPLERPLSLPPTAKVDEIIFKLFVIPHTEDYYHLIPSAESIQNSTFNRKLKTKFIIHGFLVSQEPGDIKLQMKDKILDFGEYNVIVVDWTAINNPPYSQAVANTRVVGAQIAKLINSLMFETGVEPESFHLIGHSLGAHISGYAGERIPNLGRITGLDPAGPWFRHVPPKVRLDETDAIFVDVIHTGGASLVTSGLGTPIPIGHMDFFPNGGLVQFGCASYTPNRKTVIATLINDTSRYFTSMCDHFRAVHYFIESVDNSDCKFLGVQCDSYSDYESGLCSPDDNLVAEMGFHAKSLQGLEHPAQFYMRTHAQKPFCNQDSIYI